jgi:hypothetical protein
LRASVQKWKEEYQNRPRASAQEISRAAAENWKAMREALSRVRAFEHLPEQEGLARHPELESFYEGWKTFEQELVARFPDNIDSREQYAGAARRNMIERLENGQPFTPRDASLQAAAERLERHSERQNAARQRDQELGQDGLGAFCHKHA